VFFFAETDNHPRGDVMHSVIVFHSNLFND